MIMNIDEQNGNIAYNDKAHSYWNVNDNGKYISVTTLIEKFGHEFDKEFWSLYKAYQALIPEEFWKLENKEILRTHKFNSTLLTTYNITEKDLKSKQQDILDEWYQTNLESTERGTKIHAELENMIRTGGSKVSLKKYDVGGVLTYSGSKGPIDAENGVYPEYLIYRESNDKILRLAGHIDVLVKQGNEIIIIDWKTNRKIDLKSGFDTQAKHNTMMKYPLNKLMDCNYSHYNLQLSTYAWMVCKQNPKLVVKDLILVHFNHDNKMTIYHMDYLKKEVELMLAYYKKELIKNTLKLKRLRIEF